MRMLYVEGYISITVASVWLALNSTTIFVLSHEAEEEKGKLYLMLYHQMPSQPECKLQKSGLITPSKVSHTVHCFTLQVIAGDVGVAPKAGNPEEGNRVVFDLR